MIVWRVLKKAKGALSMRQAQLPEVARELGFVETGEELIGENTTDGRLVSRGSLHMQTRACRFSPFQEVKVQEMVRVFVSQLMMMTGLINSF